MDQGSERNRTTGTGTLPRLSRLPKIVPRASHDNFSLLRGSAGEDPVKSSHLPRPSRPNTSKIAQPTPLGENVNRSVRDKYGWSAAEQSRTRHRSPVRDALQAAMSTLDTTPPNSGTHVPVFEDGDENPQAKLDTAADKLDISELGKRRPRPSLTERTMETLSAISPSPSPVRRRRSSVAIRDGAMGPPVRPASSMRNSRPTTPASGRPPSPVKHMFRPPGRRSPSRDYALPAVPSPGSLYTPPKAFVKGGSARFGRSVHAISAAGSQSGNQTGGSKVPSYASKTMRIKSSGISGSGASGARDGKVSLDSIFKDPAKSASNSGARSSVSSAGLLRPRSHGENTIAASPPSRLRPKVLAPRNSTPTTSSVNKAKPPTPTSTKSSAALRETIAKAKAAKRAAMTSQPSVEGNAMITPANFEADAWPGEPIEPGQSNKGLLRKRLEGAVASGSLNLAAMGFDTVPEEVLRMYENTASSVGWSEMVDLTKFNMGDNKLEVISDDVFPDWSTDEMYEDDEKTNQFAGLEMLDIRNNLLHSVPIGLRRMERLTSLNLSGNQLGNEVLETIWQIPQLQSLYLANNKLTGSFPFSAEGTTALRVLDLSNNQIDGFEFTHGQLSSLQRLNVSSNKLIKLPWVSLSSCEELAELEAKSNQIGGIAFEGVSGGFLKLRNLDLSWNAIDGLAAPVSDFIELQTLLLNSNRLTALPAAEKWQKLVTIHLSENKVVDMPAIWELHSLKNADLSQNNIKAIDARIATMDALTALELAGNPLRDRKYISMPTSDLKLDLEKRLDRGDNSRGSEAASGEVVNGAEGAEHSKYAFKATNGVLDLSSKGLESINVDTINFESSTVPIHTLRLTNNEFSTLPVELLCHPALKWTLKSLDISHNPRLHSTECLTDEVFLPALRSLYVVSTGLTSLDALTSHLKAPELTELNISCHRLAGHVPWVRAWYPNVTTLLASDNWFSSVDVEGVRGLEVIDIRNNQIEQLPPALGLLGNFADKREAGRLRSFESMGNLFRVPRIAVIEKGTEAVLRDLRRRVPVPMVPEEWKEEI
ncbi:uncharacterized protein HMPREF1541_04126 [Cyphellophora europaea CBS 101466]|uniref:Leucine-rich repeat-containing protein 40 n=1 Tax=Cyphellophora europaea (strain CBS 101466) TaxID=1220924 RepID=W2S0S1_CYPE1|nr:uncharacterized protein HMPREF1541_04126 [Cyphellophora europaea CBS 101466]ETN42185.1 hypothetical protein HMPREF1541_04126 [Cyphellophora europaea CBS 101466]